MLQLSTHKGRKIGFTALLTRVKSYVKYSIGFDFTFDARRRCRQIYNLFAYSFDLGKGEVKLLTTLTSPLTRVKDEVKCVNAIPLTLIKGVVKCAGNFDFTFDARQR